MVVATSRVVERFNVVEHIGAIQVLIFKNSGIFLVDDIGVSGNFAKFDRLDFQIQGNEILPVNARSSKSTPIMKSSISMAS